MLLLWLRTLMFQCRTIRAVVPRCSRNILWNVRVDVTSFFINSSWCSSCLKSMSAHKYNRTIQTTTNTFTKTQQISANLSHLLQLFGFPPVLPGLLFRFVIFDLHLFTFQDSRKGNIFRWIHGFRTLSFSKSSFLLRG